MTLKRPSVLLLQGWTAGGLSFSWLVPPLLSPVFSPVSPVPSPVPRPPSQGAGPGSQQRFLTVLTLSVFGSGRS